MDPQQQSSQYVEALKKFIILKGQLRAGQSLRQITDSVLQINERNLQIAVASEQQAHVARDVDRSLLSIRSLAIQSSEGANQTIKASNELSRLAVNLNHLVQKFKV